MNFFLRALPKPRAIRATRTYTTTPFRLYPTALHRAERAADLKAHPESALTQEKVPDRKHNHHWSEENATESEADVSYWDFSFHFPPVSLKISTRVSPLSEVLSQSILDNGSTALISS